MALTERSPIATRVSYTRKTEPQNMYVLRELLSRTDSETTDLNTFLPDGTGVVKPIPASSSESRLLSL